MQYSKIIHPASWSRKNTGGISEFCQYFDDNTLSTLDDITNKYKRGVSFSISDCSEIGRIFHPISDWIKSVEMEVLYGKGLIVLKGFPVKDYTSDERDRLFYLLGLCFGKPIQQNPEGELLGRIEDIYGLQKNARGYRSRKALELHRDRGDLVIMLCARQSEQGGESVFASGYTIYNRLIDLYPECIRELCQGFRYYMADSKNTGPEAVTRYKLPVFSWKKGIMSVNHIRAFIDKGAKYSGIPLTESQIVALDHFDEIANNKDVCLRVKLEPGDLVICNNNTVMHGRSEFSSDNHGKHSRRLLLRLWLIANNPWPMVSSLEKRNHQFKFDRG